MLAQVAANVYVTHGHLRTTSDKQQKIKEMAVNLIFEQYGMRLPGLWSVRLEGGPLGRNVPTKLHGVTA